MGWGRLAHYHRRNLKRLRECRQFKGIDGESYTVIRKGVRYTNGLSEAQCLSFIFSEV